MLTGLLAGKAEAAVFEWSYVFATGEKSFGIIKADRGETYLENFVYVSFQFVSSDGRANQRFTMDPRFFGHGWTSYIPCDGSMTGLKVNFENDTNNTYQTDFIITAGSVMAGSLSLDSLDSYSGPEVFYGNPEWAHEKTYEAERYNINYRRGEALNSSWTLRPVPDGATTALLLAIGMMASGLVMRRLRTKL